MRAPKQSRRMFVGRFPGGKPGLSAAASGTSRWQMARSEDSTSLQLRGGASNATFVGTLEGGQSSSYFLFMLRAEGVIDALPSGPWFTFRPEVKQRAVLTLEEAEARMKSRAKAGESAASWLARGAGPAAVRATPAAKPDAGDDSDSDSERVRRGGASESESDAEDGDEKGKKKRRRGAAGGAEPDADGDGAAAMPQHNGAPRDGSPDRGEDWEHEEAMTDDDEAAGVGDQVEEPDEQAVPPPPAAMQAEGEDEELDEAGRAMQRLLKQQRKKDEAGGEEEDVDDDDLSEEDDEVRARCQTHALHYA